MTCLFGNVLTFIPLGFFLPCLFRRCRGCGVCFFGAAARVVCVELVQLFAVVGSCDIDDLLLDLVADGYGLRDLEQVAKVPVDRIRRCDLQCKIIGRVDGPLPAML